jgi:Zn-ribbon-containing, possibly nucleic-acid-binding protein (DUF2310)
MNHRRSGELGRYHRLKSQSPTPEEEICGCSTVTIIVLCHALIANPLRCMTCSRELSPERLDLQIEQIDEIANWNSVYGSVYRLWLDSREYENWAKKELEAANSAINLRGLKCCNGLSTEWPTYYWWFLEYGERCEKCPKCNQKLTIRNDWTVCEFCWILVPNERP